MKINHVALYVNDLEAMKAFYMRYFDAVSNEMYHNPRTGLRTYILSFGEGAKLEIMTRPDMTDREKEVCRTGYIHLSFSVGSKEQVDALTATLKSDGYQVLSGPRTTGDGFYESCIVDGEGNQIEITV